MQMKQSGRNYHRQLFTTDKSVILQMAAESTTSFGRDRKQFLLQI